MLDRIEADRPQPEGLAHGGLDLAEREALQETQDLDVLALAGGTVIPGAHTGLQETPQGGEGLGQIPAPERGCLVEGADLALDERQVVQGIEDQVLTLIGSSVAGDDLGGAADHDPLDIAPDQHLAMAVGHRDGIVVAPVAHQRQRADPSRALVASIVSRGRQGQDGHTIPLQALPNRLTMAPQPCGQPCTASRLQVGVQRLKALDPRDGNQKVPAGVADQALDLAFVVTLAGPPEAILEEIVGLQLAEDPRALARSIAQDTRHRQRGVVVEDRARHPAKEGEGRNVPLAEGLAGLRRIGLDETGIRVRQVHGKEMDLALDPGDDRQSLAKVHLGMAGIVGQGDKDLTAPASVFPDVILDNCVAALEAMLVAQPLEDPFGRVPLLARRRAVLLKNAIDDAGEGIELGAMRWMMPPITRRHRKPQHLGNCLAMKPEYPRRLADAHPINMAGTANTPIQLH